MSRILIVDDSGLARRTLRSMLEPLGHTVEEACDGAQALERYFMNRHDLVLLDIVMQGMSGIEVLQKMHELNPEVRVIMATADIQSATRDEARLAGAAGLINKPFRREQLQQVVTSVLQGGVGWN